MKQKQTILKITMAAAISGIYIIFLFLYKILFGSLDSFLFVLLPIPAAFYTYKYETQYAFLPLAATTILSLLFIEPLQTIFFVFPGILLGSIYGILEKKNIKTGWRIAFLFILEVLLTFVSDILLVKLLGYNFIEDSKLLIENLCQLFHLNQTIFVPLLFGLLPCYFIVMGIINTYIVYIGVDLLLVRFKVKKAKSLRMPFYKSKYNKGISIVYLLLFLTTIIFTILVFNQNKVIYYLWAVFFNLTFIFSLYFIYIGLLHEAVKRRNQKQILLYFLIVLSAFFFPFYLIIKGLVISLT